MRLLMNLKDLNDVSCGRLSDEQVSIPREASLDDARIVDVIAQVSLLTLTNYLNNVAKTDIDFPPESQSVMRQRNSRQLPNSGSGIRCLFSPQRVPVHLIDMLDGLVATGQIGHHNLTGFGEAMADAHCI